MCTAATYRTDGFYFGRTLDYPCSYGEEVVLTPRRFPLPFRHREPLGEHYAILGMAHVAQGFPLYYDGMNEKGLCMAGLNFVGNAAYRPPRPGKDNVAQFELIPYLLGRCATVGEARVLLSSLNLTPEPFSPQLPPAQLHWILADREECIVAEFMADGLHVWNNAAGVLTNNPPFPQQLFALNNYMGLSPHQPENRFSPALPLEHYCQGMGAMGLPGDLSSQSRFVRAAFVRANSVSGAGEEESVSQFFHILGSVEQQRGCCRLPGGGYEVTLYTSCCSADRGIYYYATYENHRISAVALSRCKLDSETLERFPLVQKEQIKFLN